MKDLTPDEMAFEQRKAREFGLKVSSLINSGVKWAESGFPVTTSRAFDSRIAICKSCEKWDSKMFSGTGGCKICGCSTQAKLRLATEKCPIDKWLPAITDQQPKEK